MTESCKNQKVYLELNAGIHRFDGIFRTYYNFDIESKVQTAIVLIQQILSKYVIQ